MNRPELRGSKREVEVIGTFPFPRKEDVMETIVQLKGEKERITLGLLWRKGKLWGLPTDPDRPFMPFMPVSECMFTGYHLGLANNVHVSFNVNSSGFTTALTIYRKHGDAIARRVENDKENPNRRL